MTLAPTVIPMTPKAAATARARAFVERIREAQRAIARVEEDAAAQSAEIVSWRDAQVKRLRAYIEGERRALELLARDLHAAEPTDRKSIDLPGGVRLGWRDGVASARVTDEKTALRDLHAVSGSFLTRTTPATAAQEHPDLTRLKTAVVGYGEDTEGPYVDVSGPEPGERVRVHGIVYTPGASDVFYVETGS